MFDRERMRFRRLRRVPGCTRLRLPARWHRYHGLVVAPGSDFFTVVLSPDGTRLRRLWRHPDACPRCSVASRGVDGDQGHRPLGRIA